MARLRKIASSVILGVSVSVAVASPAYALIGDAVVAQKSTTTDAVAKFIGYHGADVVKDENGNPVSVPTASNCTATLISSQWIVLANHCISEGGIDDGIVTFGTTDNTDTANKKYTPEKFIPHPGGHDIALVKLDRPVEGVTPAPLWDGSLLDKDTPATIYGWGWGGIAELKPKNLMEGHGDVLPGFIKASGAAEGEQLATFESSDARITKGDSGGPVFIDGKLFGTLSGREAGTVDDPANLTPNSGYYVPVNMYSEWINSVVSDVDIPSGEEPTEEPVETDVVKPGPDTETLEYPQRPTHVDDEDNVAESTTPSTATSTTGSTQGSVTQAQSSSSYTTAAPSPQGNINVAVDVDEDSVDGADVNTGGSVKERSFMEKLVSIFS